MTAGLLLFNSFWQWLHHMDPSTCRARKCSKASLRVWNLAPQWDVGHDLVFGKCQILWFGWSMMANSNASASNGFCGWIFVADVDVDGVVTGCVASKRCDTSKRCVLVGRCGWTGTFTCSAICCRIQTGIYERNFIISNKMHSFRSTRSAK